MIIKSRSVQPKTYNNLRDIPEGSWFICESGLGYKYSTVDAPFRHGMGGIYISMHGEAWPISRDASLTAAKLIDAETIEINVTIKE